MPSHCCKIGILNGSQSYSNITTCQLDQIAVGNASRDTAQEFGLPRGTWKLILYCSTWRCINPIPYGPFPNLFPMGVGHHCFGIVILKFQIFQFVQYRGIVSLCYSLGPWFNSNQQQSFSFNEFISNLQLKQVCWRKIHKFGLNQYFIFNF